MYISFQHQFYLFFLFGIPLIIFIHFYGLRSMKGRSLKFANFEAMSKVKGIDLYSKNILVLVFNIILYTLIILSLTGMTINKEMKLSDFSFVIAIDTSQSMTAKDILPDRLSAAKETAIQFIDTLPVNSQVGILSFSGDSIIDKELTTDKNELKTAINSIDISSVAGTDVYEALYNSLKILKNENNKAVILLSDGQINVGRLQDSIDLAREKKLIIHTIAIGTTQGGEAQYGLSKVDENSLKALAYNTDGQFYFANDKDNLLKSFNEIIKITNREGELDLSPYFLIALAILFILKLFFSSINKFIW